MPPVQKPKRARRRHFLREWREYRQLSQETAAERLEIDQSTLSRLERGETPYNQDFLEMAAYAYGCEVSDLVMRNPLDNEALWALIDVLRKASPQRQSEIAAVAQALLKTGTNH